MENIHSREAVMLAPGFGLRGEAGKELLGEGDCAGGDAEAALSGREELEGAVNRGVLALGLQIILHPLPLLPVFCHGLQERGGLRKDRGDGLKEGLHNKVNEAGRD